ncbi:MAG: acyl-CoA dehydrogenase family protein [Alphaproteobacteria bacterium]|nr:acyl-CoA dehydrogenase family protein [Alphaproteobacteria bacterium]
MPASTASEPKDLNALDDHTFRTRLRRWIEANYPPEIRNPPRRLHWPEVKEWYLRLSRDGWLAPAWPREVGGLGLSPAKLLIYIEEYQRHGCARMPDQGISMVGPLLIKYGSDEQRAHFLPRILSGEYIWCQGYSEPNAGSDLASLRTEAVLEGEHYVVNGQKIWTSLAMDANWMFCLVRTDKQAKKQEGISFLLIPMDTPGISIRPIRNLDMGDEFCETFFDDVRVPLSNLVGQPNKGWTMAKNLLGFERISIGSPRQAAYALRRLRILAERMGVWDDATFQERYTRLRLDLEDHKALFETYADKVRRGEQLGPDISMLKINQTALFQCITDVMMEIAGENAGLFGPIGGNRDLNPSGLFIQARPSTIYGGSNEIQRNIVAKNVLNLPG